MNAAARDARRAPVDRTSLSWQRTAMQSAIVALFAAVTSIRLGEPTIALAAAALAGVTVVIGASTPRVKRSELDERDPWMLMVRAVVVLGVAALVGVMLVVAVALEL